MERSLQRNAKETHLNTSHRLSGVQAHTCDPTDRPRGERWHAAGRYSCTVAGSVTFFFLMILLVFLHWCLPAGLSGNWEIFPTRLVAISSFRFKVKLYNGRKRL